MSPAEATSGTASCGQCGTALPEGALLCPGCNALIHAAELERLAREAVAASNRADPATAQRYWQEALPLLPPESLQYRSVRQKIADLEKLIPPPEAAPSSAIGKWLVRLGPLGLLIWKFKTVALILLTKGKLLIFGLTKMSTLFTMMASMGLYWNWYGWKFALGLVVMIYIHEMGHVWELRKFGIKASAPVFIPGFGAVVILRERPATVAQDARVGLAGPLWGMAAACAALAMYLTTHVPLWAALTRFGAWMNLFNLIPIWQLDGSRGFAGLTRKNRGIVLGLVLLMWVLTHDGMLFVVALGCGFRMFTRDYGPAPDPPVLQRFALLLVVLSILCLTGMPSPGPGGPAATLPAAVR